MIDELEDLGFALQNVLNHSIDENMDVTIRILLRRVDMPIVGVACMMTSQFEGLLPDVRSPNQTYIFYDRLQNIKSSHNGYEDVCDSDSTIQTADKHDQAITTRVTQGDSI